MIITFFMNHYEQFRYEASVITAIYPVSPLQQNMYEDYEKDPPPANEDEAKKDLKRSVIERGKYGFAYWEFALVKVGQCFGCVLHLILFVLCCPCMIAYKRRKLKKGKSSARKNCCVRLQMRNERHKKAMAMFDDEFDIVKII